MATHHVDELPDAWFGRPVARLLVPRLLPTRITPDQLTAVTAGLGVVAGIALASGQNIVFVVSVAAMIVTDCADGELARARGTAGMRGRVADGFGDYVSGVAMHIGLALRVMDGRGFPAAAAWATAAGAALAWTAFLLDRAKRRYTATSDDPDEVVHYIDQERGIRRLMGVLFLGYSRRIAAGPAVPDLDRYQRRLRPAMVILLAVGPTTHFAVWAVFVGFDAPLAYAKVAIASAGVGAVGALLARWLERRRPPVVS